MRPPVRLPRYVAHGTILLAFVAVVVLVRRNSPNMTFLYDEWRFIEYRHGNVARSLLAPYEGNLLAVHIALYRVLWWVFGLKSYLAYQLTALGLHLVVVLLLYQYAKARVGEIPALAVALMFVTLGRASTLLMALNQANHTLNMLSLCATLLLLDGNTRRRDWLAAAALSIGLMSYGYSLVFFVGIAAELLRRREPRRLVPFAVPVALFALWYVGKGAVSIDPSLLNQPGGDALAAMGESPLRLSSIDLVPSYFARLAAYAAGALVGGGAVIGGFVLAAIVTALVARLVRRDLSPRVVMLTISLVGSWVIVSFARAAFEPLIKPEAARFVYTGGLMLTLLALELARDVTFRPPHLAVVAVLLLAALAGNVPQLRSQPRGINGIALEVRGGIAALDEAEGRVPPDAGPGTVALFGVRQGPLLRGYAAIGSRPPFDDLRTAPYAEQVAADRALIALYRVRLTDTLEPAHQQCTRVTPTGGDPIIVSVPANGGGVRALDTVVQVSLQKYSEGTSLGTVDAGRARTLTGPGEDGWKARLVSSGAFEVCGAGG